MKQFCRLETIFVSALFQYFYVNCADTIKYTHRVWDTLYM